MSIFWGDIHNHCNITYGYGSIENALINAKTQLDFCAVTGHAMWPDMKRLEELRYSTNYHEMGFKKLKTNWESVRNVIESFNKEHSFITFQSYEMHSCEYGDYHIFSPDDNLPLVYADNPKGILDKTGIKDVIAIPHHTGYTPGYRGINWDLFEDSISPVVEVYSKHGCGIYDSCAYPYYHTMGPRDSRGTIHAGLDKQHIFGFVASTDHHAGFPGSHGDGRIAVFAKSRTKRDIWEAILKRNTYAVTGDKIECGFSINGNIFGSKFKDMTGLRKISLKVRACDFLDKITIFKNTRPWKIIAGDFIEKKQNNSIIHNNLYKIRIEMGWGNRSDFYKWDGRVSLINGEFISIEPCFKGVGILKPDESIKDSSDINDFNNSFAQQSVNEINFSCKTIRNQTTLHPQTCSIILEIKGDGNTIIHLIINGKKTIMTLKELLEGSYSFHMKEYNSEAVLIHRAVPAANYIYNIELLDDVVENPCDNYYCEIRQANMQYAWISPIYVDIN